MSYCNLCEIPFISIEQLQEHMKRQINKHQVIMQQLRERDKLFDKQAK